MCRKNIFTVLVAAFLLSGCQTLKQQSNQAQTPLPLEYAGTISYEDAKPAAKPKRQKVAVSKKKPKPVKVKKTAKKVVSRADVWSRLRMSMSLKHTQTAEVKQWLDWYEKRPYHLNVVLKRARPYLKYILDEVEQRDMPGEIALLPAVESSFDPFAYSPGGAAGLWQVISRTGKHLGLAETWWFDPRRDVQKSTEVALQYLQYLQGRFTDWKLALAAYNSGEGRVSVALKKNRKAGKPATFDAIKLPQETRSYVPKLIALSIILSKPWKYDELQPLTLPDEDYFVALSLPGQADLQRVATLAGVEYDALQRLNPGFNRWATPPTGKHKILLPRKAAAAFLQATHGMPASKLISWKQHKVKTGENVTTIARRYKMKRGMLKQVNQLSSNSLRTGQILKIPYADLAKSSEHGLAKMKDTAALYRGGKGRKVSYTVQSGDSLWVIARQHDVRVKQLEKWNKLSAKKAIRQGQKLVIWQPKSALKGEKHYTVRQDESLWLIARKHDLRVVDIRRWNGLGSDDLIKPGQKLWLSANRQNRQLASKPSKNKVAKKKPVRRLAKVTHKKLPVKTIQRTLTKPKTASILSGKAANKVVTSVVDAAETLQKTVEPLTRTTPVAASKAKNGLIRYSVQKGDSLGKIAKKFGVSVSQICRWNGISVNRYLRPGLQLRIKQPQT